jgi:hypothetical protein
MGCSHSAWECRPTIPMAAAGIDQSSDVAKAL